MKVFVELSPDVAAGNLDAIRGTRVNVGNIAPLPCVRSTSATKVSPPTHKSLPSSVRIVGGFGN